MEAKIHRNKRTGQMVVFLPKKELKEFLKNKNPKFMKIKKENFV